MADPLTIFGALQERARDAYDAWRHPERPRIDIAVDTSSLANGAKATRAALEAEIARRGAAVDVGRNHGYGMQWLQPLATITWPDGTSVIYGPATPANAGLLIDEATGRVGAAAELAVGVLAGDRPGIPDIRDHLFFAHEPRERRLLRNIGLTDPESLEHYVATGGYHAYARALGRHQAPEQVRQALIDAGVTGRGGAAFPAGVKWNFLAGAQGDRYMVCNADEGDPGAWVNRIVLEGDPHLLVEGMAIAAHATGANHGFIYVRDEYPLGVERIERAVRQAEAEGLIGDDILGTGQCFRLEVIRGAGAYVCGDETGLMSSISDSRGMPRIKPPFPAQSGVFFKPSNVNNVETYANAPFVVRHDTAWYHAMGTEGMRGTRIFSFSGDIRRTGFMELPFGVPLGDVLAACGGMADGQRLHAIQSGGPLGSLLPAEALPKLVLENASFTPWDAIMGAGGIVFCGDATCALIIDDYISRFVEDESCGRCTTCHGGNQRMTAIFERIQAGGGRREDRHNLRMIDVTLQNSNCVHGQFSPKVMRNTLVHFSAEYEAHATAHRCDALTCRGLTRFVVIDPADPNLEAAAEICPVDAFRGAPGERTIDDATCIRCGACTDLAPRGVQRQAAALAPVAPALVPIA